MTENSPPDYCETHEENISNTRKFIGKVLELNVRMELFFFYNEYRKCD